MSPTAISAAARGTTRQPERVVVVGNGMAATRLAEEMMARAPGAHRITIVGAEPAAAYNRVLLSEVLAGHMSEQDVVLKPSSWWADSGIAVETGVAATAIERGDRAVRLADGRSLAYDRLVLATGSHPIRLPLPGMDLDGVLTFRTLADVRAILARAHPGSRAVVIGGGLLGLEAASGLAGAGVATCLVHLMDRLMERQLDARAAALLRRTLEARGIEVLLGAASAAIEGEGHVAGLRLKDGRLLPADLLVVSCGVIPNADLARAAGLACGRGVLVDDQLATEDPAISAIGECAEHRGRTYGLVAPAYEQAKVLARHLCGEAPAAYGGSTVATNLKVSGVHVFSAGEIEPGPGREEIVFSDQGLSLYRRLIVADGALIGAVLFGDTADGPYYLDLITRRTPVTGLRADLAFGRPLPDAA